MTEENKNKKAKQEQGTEESPQVYAVQKDLTGWRFNRREFLAAAAATGVVGAVAGCGSATNAPTATPAPTNTSTSTATPVPTDTPTPTPTPQPTLNPKERAEACRDIIAHQDSIAALTVSPNGTLLASASKDKTIKLWSLPEGALLKTLEGHSNVAWALAMNSDGSLMMSGGIDEVIIWSLPEGELVKTLEGRPPLMISPDGTFMASGSDDSIVKLWSLPEGELIKTLAGHVDEVWHLAASSEGTLLASGGEDKTIKLWSLPEGEFTSCLMDLAANEADVEGVTYEVETDSGETVTFTQPCGAPIPSGAVCVCNCVAGSYTPPCSCVGHTSGGGGGGHYWHPC